MGLTISPHSHFPITNIPEYPLWGQLPIQIHYPQQTCKVYKKNIENLKGTFVINKNDPNNHLFINVLLKRSVLT